MLQAGLVPGSHIGMGDKGTGCFAPGEGVTKGMSVLCHSAAAIYNQCSRLLYAA